MFINPSLDEIILIGREQKIAVEKGRPGTSQVITG